MRRSPDLRSIAILACALTGCDRTPTAPAPPVVRTTPSDAPPPAPAAPRAAAKPLRPIPMELRRALARGDRADLERWTTAHPDDGLGPFMLGVFHQRSDNHGPAVEQFARALELDPAYDLAHLYHGDSLFLLGDLPAARRAYEAYAAVRPQEPIAWYSIGLVDLEDADLAAAQKRFEQALAILERMRTENPRRYAALPSTRARCHARLADVHFARDDYEAARDELLESTRIAPGNISAYHTLSMVYRRLGDDAAADAALAHYEEAKRAIIGRTGGGEPGG